MAVWPAALPQFQNDGSGYKTESAILRSKMATGPPKTRVRTTKVRKFFSTTMLLTGAQMATYDTFWGNINQGNDAFTWTSPVTDATEEVKFTKEPQWRLWAGAPQATRRWAGVLELEIV